VKPGNLQNAVLFFGNRGAVDRKLLSLLGFTELIFILFHIGLSI
jgi:hypothetical protein